jgi:hypothetical protein
MACVWATARDVTRLFQPIICANIASERRSFPSRRF